MSEDNFDIDPVTGATHQLDPDPERVPPYDQVPLRGHFSERIPGVHPGGLPDFYAPEQKVRVIPPKEALFVETELSNGENPARLSIKLGDITQLLNTDAIIRPTGKLSASPDELSGGMEKSLVTAAGKEIFIDAKRQATEKESLDDEFDSRPGDLVVTTSGNLHKQGIQHIIHVNPYRKNEAGRFVIDDKALEEMIDSITKVSTDLKLESIALPVIGTGVAASSMRGNPDIAATALSILKRFNKRIAENSTSLRRVEVVIYPRFGYQTIAEVQKKLTDTLSQQEITDFKLEKPSTDPITLQL